MGFGFGCCCGTSITPSGVCSVNLCFYACQAGLASGIVYPVDVTVQTTGIPQTTIASGQNGTNGCYPFVIPASGFYYVTGSSSGYNQFNSTMSLACTGLYNINETSSLSGCPYNTFMTGCGGFALPGVSITATGCGFSQTQISDSGGHACFYLNNSCTYGFNATPPSTRYNPLTWACQYKRCLGTVGCVGTESFTAASGYVCYFNFGIGCIPTPTTINLNDSVYGDVSLIYNDAMVNWAGSKTVSYAGGTCNFTTCTAQTVTIFYTFGSTILSVQYNTPGGVLGGCPKDGVTSSPVDAIAGDVPSFSDCSPSLHGTLTEPACPAAGGSILYPGGVTFTITE